MENLNIPQTLKVQWLNSTLKFIKDDTQLLKQYPKMPSTHVEYFHNLIWQRENNIGLGFKSLYSPVWEAMKIYSVKYQFKIIIEKSVDGKNGCVQNNCFYYSQLKVTSWLMDGCHAITGILCKPFLYNRIFKIFT